MERYPILTTAGAPASPLGLAAAPDQSAECVPLALERGINFFFFYGPSSTHFVEGLRPLIRTRRDDVILASGSGARTASGLRAARRKILAALGADTIDMFFAEYIHPGDTAAAVFGDGGVLDELQQWKTKGWIRYVGASAHDRRWARNLAEDGRVDVLMHRFNMAHRKAAVEVFPTALQTGTPVIAFTATRWGTLLNPHPAWTGPPPTAPDCYRFCLAQPAVHVVLTAPKTTEQLEENVRVLQLPPMSEPTCRQWEQFGDLVYDAGGRHNHDYESQWP